MAQARKGQAREADVTPANPITMPRATFFFTAEQVAALGLNPDTAKVQLADANAVYTQIESGTMPTRDMLTQWAAATWSDHPVDRLNSALGLLQRMDLVYQIN